jgi:hypothetical protein
MRWWRCHAHRARMALSLILLNSLHSSRRKKRKQMANGCMGPVRTYFLKRLSFLGHPHRIVKNSFIRGSVFHTLSSQRILANRWVLHMRYLIVTAICSMIWKRPKGASSMGGVWPLKKMRYRRPMSRSRIRQRTRCSLKKTTWMRPSISTFLTIKMTTMCPWLAH